VIKLKRKRFLIQPLAIIYFVWMLFADKSGIAAMSILVAALHEIGHLLAAHFLKIPIRAMRFDLLGARIDVKGRILSYGEEWLLCMAGPLSSLIFSLIGSFFWSHTKLAIAFSCASLLLGLLNLLPIQTFDGGRMLECALLSFTTPQKTGSILRGCTFLFLWLLWAFSAYLMIKIADGISLFFFTLTLLARFFEGRAPQKNKKVL
jgi:membrane-associated protease RseP (regulator of RpoE activity)